MWNEVSLARGMVLVDRVEVDNTRIGPLLRRFSDADQPAQPSEQLPLTLQLFQLALQFPEHRLTVYQDIRGRKGSVAVML